MQVSLRDFRIEDLERLWAIDQRCFPPGIAYSEAELVHYMRRTSAFTIVAEVEGTISGFIVGELIRQRGHVITLDVIEAVRRHGIGSKLMLAAEQRLAEKNCLAVFLETAVTNRPAIAFYKRHDYVVIKTIPRYYEQKVDALLMGKKLAQTTASR